MGKRGPPKEPTRLKLHKGTHRKDVDGDPGKEIKPAEGVPTKPDWLGEWGSSAWDRLVSSLPDGVITQADYAMMCQFASAHDEYHDARSQVEEEGRVMQGKYSLVKHPGVAIMQSARTQIMQIAGRFGLTPSDRVGLELPDTPTDSGVQARKRSRA